MGQGISLKGLDDPLKRYHISSNHLDISYSSHGMGSPLPGKGVPPWWGGVIFGKKESF